MRIACPNCSAEYDVPDSALAAGPRMLRCARCAHQFQAALPGAAPAAAPAPPARPREAPPQPLPQPPPPPEPAPDPLPEPPAELPRPASAPPLLEVEEPLVPERDRPPPTRGPVRHSPIDPPAPERPPRPAPSRADLAVLLGWLLSLALVLAAGWATWRYHAEITAFWPPIARLYQALGVQ